MEIQSPFITTIYIYISYNFSDMFVFLYDIFVDSLFSTFNIFGCYWFGKGRALGAFSGSFLFKIIKKSKSLR